MKFLNKLVSLFFHGKSTVIRAHLKKKFFNFMKLKFQIKIMVFNLPKSVWNRAVFTVSVFFAIEPVYFSE